MNDDYYVKHQHPSDKHQQLSFNERLLSFFLQDPHSNGMMLTKTGGECVQWGWEEEEEEEKEEFEDEEGKRRRKEGGEGGQREEGGEDIEKVLFDSVTTRTRGSLMEDVNEDSKSEEPRRGVPRQASSPEDASLPSSSAALSAFPTVVSLLLCTCICLHL